MYTNRYGLPTSKPTYLLTWDPKGKLCDEEGAGGTRTAWPGHLLFTKSRLAKSSAIISADWCRFCLARLTSQLLRNSWYAWLTVHIMILPSFATACVKTKALSLFFHSLEWGPLIITLTGIRLHQSDWLYTTRKCATQKMIWSLEHQSL